MFLDWIKKTIEQKLYGDELESTYVKMVLGYQKELEDKQVVTLSNYILQAPANEENLFQGALVPRYGMFRNYPVGSEFEVRYNYGSGGFRLHHLPLKTDANGSLNLTDSIGVVTALNLKSRKKFIVLINYDQEADGVVGKDPYRVYVGKERVYFEKEKAYFEVLSTDGCVVKAENINWLKPSQEIFTLV